MTAMRTWCAAVASVAVLSGFWAPQAAAQDEGMLPRWEVAKLAEDIESQVSEVNAALANVRPEEWKEPSAVYAGQQRDLERELENVVLSAQAMGRKPEKLSTVFDTFLWLDRAHSLVASVSEGVRRYQSPATADLLDSANRRSSESIALLKEYMRQLAAAVESEMAVAHEEAQRCRSDLMSRPRD